jgi:MFS family permease
MAKDNSRWIQLLLGLACMIVISSPQYVWTLFTQPLMASLGTQLAAIQITFSILIVVQTFLSPFQGFLVDKFGPRVLLSVGGAVTGLSWILAARVTSLTGLYLTYGLLGGIGTGIVYVGVIGHMVQWFPDRRGFATGIVAAGYGMGALLTTFPIAGSMKEASYQQALFRWGLVFMAVGVVAAQGLRRPPELRSVRGDSRNPNPDPRNYRPAEMLRTPIFWLMFIMMTMMSTAGLMVTSQMAAFTRDFGMANAIVFGLPLLPLALSLDRITNRPHPSVFRLAVRSDWSREHDGDRVHTRGCRDDPVAVHPLESGRLRPDVRRRAVCLGRNLLALPFDADRHLWREARDDELRVSLYGAGDRVGARRTGCRARPRRLWIVDAGLRDHHCHELRDRAARGCRVETDAAAVAWRDQRWRRGGFASHPRAVVTSVSVSS